MRTFVLGERAVDPEVSPDARSHHKRGYTVYCVVPLLWCRMDPQAIVDDEQLQAMADVVQEAIEAGACGFSSTFAEIHQDVHGRVLPLLRPARPCMIATPFTQPFRNHVAVLAFGRVHLSA